MWSDTADGFYVFGGTDGGNYLNDVYLYHPQTTTTTTLTKTSASSTSANYVNIHEFHDTHRRPSRQDSCLLGLLCVSWSDNWIFMNVGLWTVAATVFYMILFGVPVAIYAHLLEPGMDRE